MHINNAIVLSTPRALLAARVLQGRGGARDAELEVEISPRDAVHAGSRNPSRVLSSCVISEQ
jgi:hypothetical protein